MNGQPAPDWNSKSPEVMRDQWIAYHDLRRRCPAADSEFPG